MKAINLVIPELGNWDIIKLALSNPDELEAFSKAPQEDVVWITIIDSDCLAQMINIWTSRCPDGDYGYAEFFQEFGVKD